jgi:membrane protease YdiL (CAAX protease family)
MASIGYGSSVGGSFGRQQSPLPAPNAHSYFLCILSAWISLAFGLSHAGYLNQGFLAWLGIMMRTAFLGMMWGAVYLLGHRSLLPAIVAHFLNDATALAWILFFMVTGH